MSSSGCAKPVLGGLIAFHRCIATEIEICNIRRAKNMNKRFRILFISASMFGPALLLIGSSHAEPSAPTAAATTKSENPTEACLACHGPYDKLAAETANYSGWLGGEKTTPHCYVPHKLHDPEDIPDCVRCHRPHPIPVSSAQGLPKPTVDWCYTCHHKGVLQCGSCHPVPPT